MTDEIQPANLQAELDNLRAENKQLRTELESKVAGALGAVLAIPLVALAGEARRIFMGSDEEVASAGGQA